MSDAQRLGEAYADGYQRGRDAAACEHAPADLARLKSEIGAWKSHAEDATAELAVAQGERDGAEADAKALRAELAEWREIARNAQAERDNWNAEHQSAANLLRAETDRADRAEAAQREYVRVVSDIVYAAEWHRGKSPTVAEFVRALRERADNAEQSVKRYEAGWTHERTRAEKAEAELVSAILRAEQAEQQLADRTHPAVREADAAFLAEKDDPQPIRADMAAIVRQVNAYNARTDRR
ncbi:hypothetical protein [Saccharopolyspora sp. NPDC002376]